MRNEIFANISKIIERDSKSTTYKFALLRGVIEIIQENSPYIKIHNDRVHFPLGLLIEKWMLYYYPLFESPIYIPQINGTTRLAFEAQLIHIITSYQEIGGFSAFYNDLKNKGIPNYMKTEVKALAKKMKDTITNMPMRYIGRSLSEEYYSIFQFTNQKRGSENSRFDIETLINGYGQFSIPLGYFEAFQFLGSFISGQDSILFKWAEFSVNASKQQVEIERVVGRILKSPITERDVVDSKQLYKDILNQKGKVFCVWTGKPVISYDIDHVIPFSVWRNNDLWNLLPAQKKVNSDKRDHIPSPDFIEKRKDDILNYWELVNESQPQRFRKEIQVALLGSHPLRVGKIMLLNN